MAGISSTGIGSGLDVKSIVSQLVALESKPLEQLQSRNSSLSSKISTWGTVKSQLSAVQDAAQKLMGLSSWNTRALKSSNETAVTGTAAEGATVGSFAVNVTRLAQAQSTKMANPVSTGTTFSAGRLDISLGDWNTPSSFGAAVSVNLSDGDTLSSIASKINGTANAGVTATVIKTGAGEQLVMRSNSTGASMGFKVQAFDGGGAAITDGTGLGALAYDGTSTGNMTRTQEGLDATATIEGINITSASNTLTDAVPGLTLNLQQLGTSTVTVSNDTKPAKDAIDGFVKAYNTIVSNLSNLTKYDAGTKTAGSLQGDGTAVGLLNTLKNMVGATGPAGTSYNRMSDVGLELQRDGTLTTNTTKLTAALANPTQLKTFFSDVGTTSTDTGLARRFYDYAFGATGTSGVVSSRNNALQQTIDRNKSDMDRMQARINKTEERLYKTYSALDGKMASLNAMNSYVTQQISAWSNMNKSN